MTISRKCSPCSNEPWCSRRSTSVTICNGARQTKGEREALMIIDDCRFDELNCWNQHFKLLESAKTAWLRFRNETSRTDSSERIAQATIDHFHNVISNTPPTIIAALITMRNVIRSTSRRNS